MTQQEKDQAVAKTLLTGSLWTSLGEVLNGASNLAAGVIAARVLTPRDFGLMATVMLAVHILEHFSLTGFETALVQKKQDIESYLNVAWTWHVGRSTVIALILCGLSVPIAAWYAEPRLTALMLAIAPSVLLTGCANIGTVFFTRKLDFRTLFLISSGRTLMRLLVFIPAIFYFRNVWALVVANITGVIAHVIISYISHPYRPKLAWDSKRLKELIRYGKWITGLAWIGFVIGRGDDLFVSKYLGITLLGIYQLSYDVSNLPTINITHVIGRVGLPVYARLQDDKPALRGAFTNLMRTTLLVSGPVGVFIYITAPDFVAHVVGPQWEPTIPLIRILVISGMVRSFAALAGPLFQAVGRPDLDFKMNFPRFLVVLFGVWPAAAHSGLAGVCYVVLAAICMCTPVWLWGVHHLTGLRPLQVLRENILAVVSSAALALCLGYMRSLFGASVLHAIAGIVLGVGLWLAVLAIVGYFTPYNLFVEVRRLQRALKEAARRAQPSKKESALAEAQESGDDEPKPSG